MSPCLCAVCKVLFDQPGAILFTTPDADGLRYEIHVCAGCAERITSGKQCHPYTPKTRYPGFTKPVKCVCCIEDFILPGGLLATVPNKNIQCRVVHICPRCQNTILNVSHTQPT